ncbi:carbohydrate-binding family 9-like protein [Paenibacillus sp. sptzw28]|uniref:carbohydrate-binding family 9-like protein n=1 Tax=Paenibacillus sp. sptzw28 TaxID=715179 RepID=UPI001C6F2777|nr:carbohydrate-binding family 9-like protein [Paenibacillus sp. sptzw28]QYR24058.1 carbohydrate-binding family 9-like protein [Paenibacillus sp. sptzw28]
MNLSGVPEPKLAFAPKHYMCRRAAEPLLLDGRLDKPFWAKADWTDDFVDIEGDLRPKPGKRTRVKMLWDDDCFYFGAELEEDQIWATLTERDSVIFYDNDFEIFIDPDGDSHQYYEFEINALNTVWDLLLVKPYRDGGPAVNGWDISGLRTAVHIDGELNRPGAANRKWSVEVAMPWTTLRECAPEGRPPVEGEYWRVNFSRVEWRTEVVDGKYRKVVNPETGKPYPEDNWVWSPMGIVNMHYPELWGYVIFDGGDRGEAEPFRLPPDELVKWELRKLYYRQRNRYAECGEFTGDSALLMGGDSWTICPTIEITGRLFEISAPSADERSIWRIREDGMLWKERSV